MVSALKGKNSHTSRLSSKNKRSHTSQTNMQKIRKTHIGQSKI